MCRQTGRLARTHYLSLFLWKLRKCVLSRNNAIADQGEIQNVTHLYKN